MARRKKGMNLTSFFKEKNQPDQILVGVSVSMNIKKMRIILKLCVKDLEQ